MPSMKLGESQTPDILRYSGSDPKLCDQSIQPYLSLAVLFALS